MVTISQRRSMIERTRDRPRNMTGLILCTLLAIPFWGGLIVAVL